MSEELFRKKSLEKIKSPESLNDYVRVTDTGVWLIIAAIAALLIGTCVWGVFGHIDTAIPAAAVAKDGVVTCTAEDISAVEVGMTVRLGGSEGIVTAVGSDSVTVSADVPDGVYAAEIVLESVKPFSFVLSPELSPGASD